MEETVPRWTAESRQRQSDLIKNWQPWKSSTGAVSDEGKAIVSQNAIKHGWYSRDEIAVRQRLTAMIKRRAAIDRSLFW